MLMGLRAGRALWYGASIVKKCAVQPVSAMARWPLGIGMGMGIGGPGVRTGNGFVGSDKSGESHKIDILVLLWTGSGGATIAFPRSRGSRPSQPRVGVVPAAVEGAPGRRGR